MSLSFVEDLFVLVRSSFDGGAEHTLRLWVLELWELGGRKRKIESFK